VRPAAEAEEGGFLFPPGCRRHRYRRRDRLPECDAPAFRDACRPFSCRADPPADVPRCTGVSGPPIRRESGSTAAPAPRLIPRPLSSDTVRQPSSPVPGTKSSNPPEQGFGHPADPGTDRRWDQQFESSFPPGKSPVRTSSNQLSSGIDRRWAIAGRRAFIREKRKGGQKKI